MHIYLPTLNPISEHFLCALPCETLPPYLYSPESSLRTVPVLITALPAVYIYSIDIVDAASVFIAYLTIAKVRSAMYSKTWPLKDEMRRGKRTNKQARETRKDYSTYTRHMLPGPQLHRNTSDPIRQTRTHPRRIGWMSSRSRESCRLRLVYAYGVGRRGGGRRDYSNWFDSTTS